ncbi:hypothetical protein HYU18_01475 [Candidatus Woesearchaeota archaeon]|nr:hypothetical protein [Candidatus Woesearchaeota archaeon]
MTFNVEVSEKIEQPLMSRAVLKGVVVYDSAPPSFAELRKFLAPSLKSDESLVVVQKLEPVFGIRRSVMEAHVYKSRDAVESFASKVIIARNSPRVKKAAAPKSE